MPGRRFRAASLNLFRGAERFPPLPENTSFGELRRSFLMLSVDQSAFREGGRGKKHHMASLACSYANHISYGCAAANGAGHCPVRKAASRTSPPYLGFTGRA